MSTHGAGFGPARALRIFVASLLVVTTLGLLARGLSEAGGKVGYLVLRASRPLSFDLAPTAGGVRREQLLGDQGARIYQRTLTVEADAQSIRARYDLYLDKHQPLFAALLEDVVLPRRPEDGYELNSALFGRVEVNGHSLYFASADTEIDEASSIARVRLTSEPLSFSQLWAPRIGVEVKETLYGGKPSPEVSEVEVITDGVRLVPDGAVPRHQYPGRTYFTDVRPTFERPFRFTLVVPAPPPRAGPEAAPKPISSALHSLDRTYFIALEPLLLGLFYAAPFLLFLRLARLPDAGAPPEAALHFDVARLFVILYGGLALVTCLSDLLLRLPLWVAGGGLSSGGLSSASTFYRLVGDPWSSTGALTVLFSASVWPGLVRAWERREGEGGGTPLRGVLGEPRARAVRALAVTALLFCVGLYALVFTVEQSFYWSPLLLDRFQPWRPQLVPAAQLAHLPVAAAALFFACCWMMYEVYGRRRAAASAAWACLLMLAYAFVQGAAYFLWLNVALAVLLLLPAAYAFLRVGFPLAAGRAFRGAGEGWPAWGRAALAAGLAALAFLLVWPEWERFRGVGSWSHVSAAMWAVGRLGIFALLWMLLRALRRLSEARGGRALTPAARAAGEALALSFFFLPAQRWLYLPVAFALGWLMLRAWAFEPREPAGPEAARAEQMRRAVREIISLNDAVRGLRMFRKEMLGRLSKGEIEYPEFARKVEDFEKALESRRQDAPQDARAASADALAFGPSASAWERAATAARYGSLFAVPWVLLFLNNFGRNEVPGDYSRLLSLLISAALTLSQWPLYGLFFGYFYPHLRGANGMRKGFNFFLLVFVPLLAATAVTDPASRGAWATFALWALQLFIQSLLLGLVAGDYETLRGAGLGWRHLIDVHNLSALAAWGSSLLVALGAAVTTLITSGAAGLIGTGFQLLFLPDAPAAPTPSPPPGP